MPVVSMTQLNGGSTTNPTGFVAHFTTLIANNIFWTMVHNFGHHAHQVYTASDVSITLTTEGAEQPAGSTYPYILSKTADQVVVKLANGVGPQSAAGGRMRVYAKVPHSVNGRVRP